MDDYFEDVDSYNAESPPSNRKTLKAATLDRPIRTLSLRKPICLDAARPAGDAIRTMSQHRMGSVLVTRDGLLVGIFTERDVLNRLALGEEGLEGTPLGDLMRPDPECLSPETPMAYALNLMSVGGFRHVPLVDDQRRPVGVVSVRDIVNYLVDHFPHKVLNLPPDQGEYPSSREGA